MRDNKSKGIGVNRCLKGVIIGGGDSHHSRVERRGLVSRSERRGEGLDGKEGLDGEDGLESTEGLEGKEGLEGTEGLDGEEGPARGQRGARRQRGARGNRGARQAKTVRIIFIPKPPLSDCSLTKLTVGLPPS